MLLKEWFTSGSANMEFSSSATASILLQTFSIHSAGFTKLVQRKEITNNQLHTHTTRRNIQMSGKIEIMI